MCRILVKDRIAKKQVLWVFILAISCLLPVHASSELRFPGMMTNRDQLQALILNRKETSQFSRKTEKESIHILQFSFSSKLPGQFKSWVPVARRIFRRDAYAGPQAPLG